MVSIDETDVMSVVDTQTELILQTVRSDFSAYFV
jgi:hypothetical protein